MALDILHDNWGPYTHTEVENALKAYLSGLDDRINKAIQSGGVGLTDLSAEVQALLNKADTALQPENIAAWAKAQNKPGYTVGEITGVEGFQNLLAKLQDMDQKIQAAGQSGGVDPDDEMSSTSEKPVQNKVIKAYVDGLIQGVQNVLNTITQDGATQGVIDTFNEVKAFLEGISSSDTLAAKLATLVPQTRTINGKALSSNVTIGMSDIQGLVDAINNAGNGAVSVTTNQDGTFTIHVVETDYTINLNHTHEGMVKLEKVTESTLPQTFADDTIYVQVDDVTTPADIEALYIFGLEFTGGGAAPGAPRLISPSQSQISNGIDIGNTTSGTSTYSLNIKAKDLTQSLLVEWGSGSTGYSFNTSNLPTGVTYDSGTGKLTITKEAACGINGVNIPVVYTGNDTDENAEGTIGISSSSVDGINVAVTFVVNKVTYEDLAGVKLTGTQWMQTDYCPNENTEFEIDCRLFVNDRTSVAGDYGKFVFRSSNAAGNNRYDMNFGNPADTATARYNVIFHPDNGVASIAMLAYPYSEELLADHLILKYTIGATNGTFSVNGGTEKTATAAKKTGTTAFAAAIGYDIMTQKAFGSYDIIIYRFTFKENGVNVRNYVPKMKGGVPGLYDTVTGAFISSETAKTSGLESDELVAIPLT